MVFLALAAFGSGMSLRVTDALLPRLALEFQVPLGEASYVITVFSIAYGLSQLFFGPLGDRFGKCLVVACACLACAVTALLCALATDFSWLLGARLLAGSTAAAIIPLSMAWIGDVVPYEQRQPVLARFLIGQILGLSAGVLAGGYAAEQTSWRLPFFGLAMLFVIMGVTLLFLNRRLPAAARQTRHASGPALQRLLSEFSQVLARPWARITLLTVFLEGACVFGTFSFLASHLHQVHQVSLATAGLVVMLFGLGGLLFALTSARLVRRLGEAGLSRWGGVILALTLALTALAPVWWWVLPLCLLAGTGFYMLHNTLQINATQMAPERRGAAVSSFSASFYMGQSCGVALAGWAVGHTGTTAIILVGAAGTLLLALNFSRLRARRQDLENVS